MVAKKKTTKSSQKKKKSASKKTSAKKKVSQKKSTSKKAPAKSKKSTKKKAAVKKTSVKKASYMSIDKQILLALSNAPDNSLVVDEIQEKLNISSEDLEKSIKRLITKEPPKIRTNLVMYQSRWVKQLTKIEDFGIDSKKDAKSEKLVWDTLNDLPCFICPYTKKCNEGQKQYNPKKCPYLTDWLICSINGEKYTGNPFHLLFDSKKEKVEKILD